MVEILARGRYLSPPDGAECVAQINRRVADGAARAVLSRIPAHTGFPQGPLSSGGPASSRVSSVDGAAKGFESGLKETFALGRVRVDGRSDVFQACAHFDR